MKIKNQTKVQPIEEFTLGCIRHRDLAELRRLLIEGVEANACAGELLLSAARCGSAPMIRLLFSFGAVVSPGQTVQLLGLPVAAASPAALMEVLNHLDASVLQAALRRSDHAVIVIAGDVRTKARRYLKARVRLNQSQIRSRRDELLGDAVRFAHFELGERREHLWPGIVQRSEQCARILHNVFVPLSKRDNQAVKNWLADHSCS